MTRVLVIDDEPINHQLVAHALESLKCELHYAENGKDGIATARNVKPDVIITDVMMPEINGYETTRLLRREAELSTIPILVLTAQAGLQDKLKSFEAGADDHLTKPFEGAELLARVASLLRRAEFLKASRVASPASENAFCIAIHSLRGGVGCSSLAVNLSIGLAELWKKQTILLDLTMTAGQIALMLNMTLRRTWTDIARFAPGELEPEVLASIIGMHDSGLSFIAAPTFPSQAEALNNETLSNALHMLKGQYEYIIADLPHDFSEPALLALDVADIILMVGSPDMASIRAATAALSHTLKMCLLMRSTLGNHLC
jgi:pilus assembly protein CpaE